MPEMKTPRALVFYGGWEGHFPRAVAERLKSDLEKRAPGLQIDLSDSLSPLDNAEALRAYRFIVPCWTMGTLTDAQGKNLVAAVRAGTGLGGLHGGMGDAFRGNLDYEWMVGGHFVGHPHVGDYTVRLTARRSPITDGLPLEIPYRSEQYYLLVDPGIETLAEALYTHEGRRCVMPVAWTKMWGEGRVFYSALGHAPEEFDTYPDTFELALRGLLWAGRFLADGPLS
jgi:hypothetical protein